MANEILANCVMQELEIKFELENRFREIGLGLTTNTPKRRWIDHESRILVEV